MGGGLMQLVAYGAQDIYLTGQPQITFFKSVYRRHTNFSMESIVQTIQGTVGAGKRVSVTVSRNGDLVMGVTAEVTPNATTANFDGYEGNLMALFSRAELEVGGQMIDRLYSDWMCAWASLSQRHSETDSFAMIQNPAYSPTGGKVFIPLPFFFHQNPGLAVPLIALQYHEVKFNLEFVDDSTINGIKRYSWLTDGLNDLKVYVDYAYLDTTERRKFAENAHEYLITQHQQQVQTIPASGSTQNVDMQLRFNHPVKFLCWQLQDTANAGGNTDVAAGLFFQRTRNFGTGKITLNGHDRFTARPDSYFLNKQFLDGWAGQIHPNTYARDWAMYSFALNPLEHQPSGTCNFSRIDNAQLKLTGVSATVSTPLRVHAENYNVLRIMSGMGGLAYSN